MAKIKVLILSLFGLFLSLNGMEMNKQEIEIDSLKLIFKTTSPQDGKWLVTLACYNPFAPFKIETIIRDFSEFNALNLNKELLEKFTQEGKITQLAPFEQGELGPKGATHLHAAVELANVAWVVKLLGAGVKTDLEMGPGITPLMKAFENFNSSEESFNAYRSIIELIVDKRTSFSASELDCLHKRISELRKNKDEVALFELLKVLSKATALKSFKNALHSVLEILSSDFEDILSESNVGNLNAYVAELETNARATNFVLSEKKQRELNQCKVKLYQLSMQDLSDRMDVLARKFNKAIN